MNNIVDDYFSIKLHFGDIILAHRSAKELEKHHEISPHIVIGKEEDYYVVLQGSSQKNEKYDKYQYLIEKDEHGMTKNTYFNMTDFRRIHKDKIISRIDRLTKKERNYIQKIISYYNTLKQHNTDWVNIYMPEITVGDIIGDYDYRAKDNKFLIIENTDEYYRCIPLKETSSKDDTNINGHHYIFYYDDIKEIRNKEDYIRFFTLTVDQTKIVLTKVKNNLISKKNQIKRGSLISLNGNLYYVYNKEKNNLITYKVSLNNQKDTSEILINNTKYYTKFKEKKLSISNDNLFFIDQAEDKEIQHNKSIKKEYLKLQKESLLKEKNKKNKAVDVSSCVVGLHDNRYYVVLYRIGNEVCVIDYDSYIEGKKIIKLFSANVFSFKCRLQINEFRNILEFSKSNNYIFTHENKFNEVYKSFSEITEVNKIYKINNIKEKE